MPKLLQVVMKSKNTNVLKYWYYWQRSKPSPMLITEHQCLTILWLSEITLYMQSQNLNCLRCILKRKAILARAWLSKQATPTTYESLTQAKVILMSYRELSSFLFYLVLRTVCHCTFWIKLLVYYSLVFLFEGNTTNALFYSKTCKLSCYICM